MKQLITNGAQISEILRARRRTVGISQAELATKLGISQNRLSELEADAGQLRADRLIEMLNLLGLRMSIEPRNPHDNEKDEW